MSDLTQLYDAIVSGNHRVAEAVTIEALGERVPPMELVSKYMVPAMDEVGRRFECEDYFVPELLLAARAMKAALQHIRPLLVAEGASSAGRVVIGTVKGDLHDIGKNIVGAMLEGAGFDVIDLGADVSPQKFVEAVKEQNPNLVCLSALLTVTMPAMKSIIDALREAGVRDSVKVLVGGAPVTKEFATDIGADGYGENASVAVSLARGLVKAQAA